MAMQAATLEILEKADLPPKQARAIAQAIELEVSAGHSVLATRADWLALQHGLELRFSHLEGKIDRDAQDGAAKLVAVKQELDAKIAGVQQELRVQIAEQKGEIVRWVFVCMLGQTATLLGVGYFLFSHVAAA